MAKGCDSIDGLHGLKCEQDSINKYKRKKERKKNEIVNKVGYLKKKIFYTTIQNTIYYRIHTHKNI